MTNTNSNNIPTPEYWHWKITPEDVAKIKMNDRETINKVYFENYEKFKKVALSKASKFYKKDMWEDCLQQIYIDLPRYNYTNAQTFFRGLLETAYCSMYPNRCLSLESEVEKENDDRLSLLDQIPVNGFAELDRKESEKRVLELIAEQTGLNELQRDTLVAIAFKCALYKGIFKYEYTRIAS